MRGKPGKYKRAGRTWDSYRGMKSRCNNKNNPDYYNYGGRGIKVCERWLDFDLFVDDMGIRPEGKTLDRINSELGYSPNNCRWATIKEQSKNNRCNVYFELNGIKKIAQEWIDEREINKATFWWRIYNGWTFEDAIGGVS